MEYGVAGLPAEDNRTECGIADAERTRSAQRNDREQRLSSVRSLQQEKAHCDVLGTSVEVYDAEIQNSKARLAMWRSVKEGHPQ